MNPHLVFKIPALTVKSLFFLLFFYCQNTYSNNQFELGKDYLITSAKASDEPILEEFFNYACSACYSMEVFLDEFKQNNPSIKIKPIPVELRPSWQIYVAAFYIGEKLGVLNKSHAKIFHRIHVEKKHFKNPSDMKDFFINLGIEEAQYDQVADSYWLQSQIRQSRQYAFAHKVSTTPTLLVNQRFKLDGVQLGSYQRIEQAIVEFAAKH